MKTSRIIGLLGAAALTACGGGGGGPSGSASSFEPTSTESIVTSGAITGFGSVFVNGTRFDVNGATVTDDGHSSTADDLRVGQIVRIEAERHGNDDMPRALKIAHDTTLRGVIATIDTAGGTLTVLGQTVVVDADTLFDDDISTASLAGLAVGEIVRVDAFVAADGSLHATRIERERAAAELEVTGRIASLDTTKSTFKINLITVVYDIATLEDFAASGPADGDLVEVKGSALNGAGQLVATSVELKRPDDARDSAADEVEIEGLVTRFASATDLDVNGHKVTTTSTTLFEGGTLADLAVGVKLEVEGTVNADGVLVADKVSLRHNADIRIDADVEAIDTTAGTLRALGITVRIDMHTRFDDRGSGDDRFLALAHLHVGDRVEIRAVGIAGTDGVLATRLERESDGDGSVELTGPVGIRAEPSFEVLGATVATLPGTQLEGGLTVEGLFGDAQLMVDVRGSWDGTTLTAERVELTDELSSQH